MKPRRRGTFEDGIMRIVGAMGADAAGAVIGKSGSLVRKAADPDDEYKLPLPYALALDTAYVLAGHGDAPIYRAYRHLVLLVRAPEHKPAEPFERFMDVARETGELAAELRNASAGGHYSPADCARLHGAVGELEEVIAKLKRDIDARATPVLDMTGKFVKRA